MFADRTKHRMLAVIDKARRLVRNHHCRRSACT